MTFLALHSFSSAGIKCSSLDHGWLRGCLLYWDRVALPVAIVIELINGISIDVVYQLDACLGSLVHRALPILLVHFELV